MGKGRRYSAEEHLNLKKVFAVIIAFVVIIMAIVIVKKVLTKAKNSTPIEILDYFALYQDDKWGILGSNGTVVIDPMYQEMPIVVDKNKDVFLFTYDINEEDGSYKIKAVNSKNEEIFTNYDKVEALENYDQAGNVWYEENVLKVQKDGKWGLIDLNGNEILNIAYDNIETLKGIENSLIIKSGDLVGLINNKGTQITDCQYSQITSFGDDYKNGYITVLKAGEVIVNVSVSARQGDGTINTVTSQLKLNVAEAPEQGGETEEPGDSDETENTDNENNTENTGNNTDDSQIKEEENTQKDESKISENVEALTTSPHTGDMNIVALIALMIISLIGMVIIVKKK